MKFHSVHGVASGMECVCWFVACCRVDKLEYKGENLSVEMRARQRGTEKKLRGNMKGMVFLRWIVKSRNSDIQLVFYICEPFYGEIRLNVLRSIIWDTEKPTEMKSIIWVTGIPNTSIFGFIREFEAFHSIARNVCGVDLNSPPAKSIISSFDPCDYNYCTNQRGDVIGRWSTLVCWINANIRRRTVLINGRREFQWRTEENGHLIFV